MIELGLDTPKIFLYTTPSFNLTFGHPETKKFANSKNRKGHNSYKNLGKIAIIELDIDNPKIYLYYTFRFNSIFRSQVIIRKSIRGGRTTPITIVPFDEVSGTKM